MNNITKKDCMIGFFLSLFMICLFTYLSSDYELIVTFVIGVPFAFAIFLTLYRRVWTLSEPLSILPLYFGILSWQFIHFFEEFITGFSSQFPAIYGGEAYSVPFFLLPNMISYFLFTVTAILAFVKRLPFLLIPALFFITYGALGNAITHTTWSIYFGKYFPGLYTAQLYWILAPLFLRRLTGSWSVTLKFIIPYVISLPIALIWALV